MNPPDELSQQESDTPETLVLQRLLTHRRSCRAFLPRPVPDPTIRRILALAQSSASWCNVQPWQVIVTRGAATDRLRSALMEDLLADPTAQPDFPFPSSYKGVFLERRREVAWQLYQALGIGRGDREASRRAGLRNFLFFDAPHVAIITSERCLGVYGAVDCGSYLANFMLAAESLGVATIAQASLAQRAPFLRKFFEIADDRVILLGVSFGYADTTDAANNFSSKRADLRDVVRWEA